MESTLYGHPDAPRLGPRIPAPLLRLQFADFGLNFKGDGDLPPEIRSTLQESPR